MTIARKRYFPQLAYECIGFIRRQLTFARAVAFFKRPATLNRRKERTDLSGGESWRNLLFLLYNQNKLAARLNDISERELFAQIALGDEKSFRQLFISYAPQLSDFFSRITHDTYETDDCIQEIFSRIWLSRHLLSPVENPRAYIYGIASHVSVSWIKKRMRQRTQQRQLSPGQLQTVTSDRHIFFRDLKRMIEDAVNKLSPQRRKIYLLSRERGLTVPEISEQLNLSSNTVKNTLISALSEIRRHLKNSGYEFPVLFLSCLHF